MHTRQGQASPDFSQQIRDEFVFTESTTQSISIFANMLKLNKGDTIVTRGGASEHPSNYVPWHYYANKKGARVIDVPVDRNGLPDLSTFDSILKTVERPKLVVLGHVIYNLGTIIPVQELSKIAHERHFSVFLDIAQSVGSLPVDLNEIGIDFAAGTTAKWLCGPFGLGFFYFRRESLASLEPTDYSEVLSGLPLSESYDSSKMPLFYFRNYAYTNGLQQALHLILQQGIDEIRSKNQKLVNILIEGLSDATSNYRVLGDLNDSNRASIVAIEPSHVSAAYIVKRLALSRITVAERDFLGKKIIRVSPHFYNDEHEMVALLDALSKLAT